MQQLLSTHQQVGIQVVLLSSWLMGRQRLSTTLSITTVGLLKRLEETQRVQVHMVSGEQWEPGPVGNLFPSRSFLRFLADRIDARSYPLVCVSKVFQNNLKAR